MNRPTNIKHANGIFLLWLIISGIITVAISPWISPPWLEQPWNMITFPIIYVCLVYPIMYLLLPSIVKANLDFYLRKAEKHITQEEYSKAQALVDYVLKSDPLNQKAQAIKSQIDRK